jgi:hypothetical protein
MTELDGIMDRGDDLGPAASDDDDDEQPDTDDGPDGELGVPGVQTGTQDEQDTPALQGKGIDGGASRYRGVSWHPRQKKWHAELMVGGRLQPLGPFADEQEAARAYDTAVRRARGSSARLNFPHRPAGSLAAFEKRQSAQKHDHQLSSPRPPPLKRSVSTPAERARSRRHHPGFRGRASALAPVVAQVLGRPESDVSPKLLQSAVERVEEQRVLAQLCAAEQRSDDDTQGNRARGTPSPPSPGSTSTSSRRRLTRPRLRKGTVSAQVLTAKQRHASGTTRAGMLPSPEGLSEERSTEELRAYRAGSSTVGTEREMIRVGGARAFVELCTVVDEHSSLALNQRQSAAAAHPVRSAPARRRRKKKEKPLPPPPPMTLREQSQQQWKQQKQEAHHAEEAGLSRYLQRQLAEKRRRDLQARAQQQEQVARAAQAMDQAEARFVEVEGRVRQRSAAAAQKNAGRGGVHHAFSAVSVTSQEAAREWPAELKAASEELERAREEHHVALSAGRAQRSSRAREAAQLSREARMYAAHQRSTLARRGAVARGVLGTELERGGSDRLGGAGRQQPPARGGSRHIGALLSQLVDEWQRSFAHAVGVQEGQSGQMVEGATEEPAEPEGEDVDEIDSEDEDEDEGDVGDHDGGGAKQQKARELTPEAEAMQALETCSRTRGRKVQASVADGLQAHRAALLDWVRTRCL